MGTTTATTDATGTAAGTDPQVARLVGLMDEVMAGRATLADAAGVTARELEAVYALAHGQYSAGRYADATELFRFLVLHGHTTPKYWFGLGAATQMAGDVAAAVKAYGMAAVLDVSDPQVPLRAAECFARMGDTKNARAAAEASTIVAGSNSAHAEVAGRARLLLARLGGPVEENAA